MLYFYEVNNQEDVKVKGSLLFEEKEYGQDEQGEPDEMVEAEVLVFETDKGQDGEDGQRERLLDHLELPEVEGAAVACVADAVGGNHETVFQASHQPAEQDDDGERQLAESRHALELEVAIPGEEHETVADYEQKDTL